MMHFFHKYFFCCHQIMDTVKNIAVRGFNIYLAQVSSFQQNNTIGFSDTFTSFLGNRYVFGSLAVFSQNKAEKYCIVNIIYKLYTEQRQCLHSCKRKFFTLCPD